MPKAKAPTATSTSDEGRKIVAQQLAAAMRTAPISQDLLDRVNAYGGVGKLMDHEAVAGEVQLLLAKVKDTLLSAMRAASWFATKSVGKTPQSVGMRHSAIAAALDDQDELAKDTRVHGELENELYQRLLAMFESAEDVGEDSLDPAAPPTSDSIFAFDAHFARHLERTGETGKELAAELRTNAAKRLEAYLEAFARGESKPRDLMMLWYPREGGAAPNFAIAMARALWLDVVRPRLRRPPALVYPVMIEALRLHSRTFKSEERDGQRVLLFDDNNEMKIERGAAGLRLPACDLVMLDDMIDRGVNLLGSVLAHQALRWEVIQGHHHGPDLTIEGGWSKFAELLGARGHKAAEQLKAIVTTQARCFFRLPHGGYGNLLALEVIPAQGQRKGSINLTLGTALRANYVSQVFGEDRKLVPMVDLPPFVGRPNEHGQQATFSLALVAEMRLRSSELAEHGGVLFDRPKLDRLAMRSGLKLALIDAVIERWTHDGDAAKPAFLKRIEPQRYTLGDAHAAARDFLVKGGEKSALASKAGQKGAAKRNADIERMAKGKGRKGK